MSDLTDNYFFAKRIWLCLRLNNAGKYCDVSLKIMVMLQNVCECNFRILEEKKHRQLRILVLRMFVLVKKVKETGILLLVARARQQPMETFKQCIK